MKKIFYRCTLLLLISLPVYLPGKTVSVEESTGSRSIHNSRPLIMNLYQADNLFASNDSYSFIDGRRVSDSPPVYVEQARDNSEAELVTYQENIKIKIEKNKKYPKNARRRDIQGSVDVSFTVYPDGSCKDVKIYASSSFPVLDNAAVNIVHSSAPFPQFPEKVTNEYIQMIVSIVFKKE